MCQTKAAGGRRCTGTPTGRALHRMYTERRLASAGRAEVLTREIADLKAAAAHYGGGFVSPFTMDLDPGVRAAVAVLAEVGDPLIVGGSVRDALHGAAPKDIDIEVYGVTSAQVAAHLRSQGFQVDEVGRAFGVLKVSKRGVVSDLDVAVPRSERRTGPGHRGFEVTEDPDMSVTEGAARRDYTVNAIMFSPGRGVLVDPFGGRADLEGGVLRHVSHRFAEDPLRVLRGVQFAARFGLRMDPQTAQLCRELRDEFPTLSRERVWEEWSKLFTKGVDPAAGLDVLTQTGWDDIHPGLRQQCRSDRVRAALSGLPSVTRDVRGAFGAAALADGLPEGSRRALISATTTSGGDARLAHALCAVSADPGLLSDPYRRRCTAYAQARSGWTHSRQAEFSGMLGDANTVELARAGIADGLGDGPAADLVSGRAIITAAPGRRPGPWVGEMQLRAREAQYRGELSGPRSARRWLAAQLRG